MIPPFKLLFEQGEDHFILTWEAKVKHEQEARFVELGRYLFGVRASQNCGRFTELQAHHTIPPSQLGNDDEQNLITLCASCHQDVHLNTKGNGA